MVIIVPGYAHSLRPVPRKIPAGASFGSAMLQLMSISKFRWSKVYESSEEELLEYLASKGIRATRFTAELGSEPVHYTNTSDAIILCAEGSLGVRTDSANISLQPGDAVRIDAETSYDLHAGISGYVCYVTA